MLIPLAVFIGVIALILGVYWAFVLRQEDELVERLRPKSDAARVRRMGVLKPEDRMSSVGPLDAMLHRSSSLTRPLQELVIQSGVKITLGTLLLMSGCFAAGGYLLGVLLTGFQIVGLLLGLLLMFAPYSYVKRQKTKRLYKFEEQFPEAIDLIARALRAGHALPTGLGMVADEIPPPVGTEFRILYDEQNFGLTLTDAVRNFAARIPVLDARFFATAVLTQRETGGNLAEVLDNLAAVIRERFKVKRQVRVISAHGRITGWVLACLPPAVGVAAFAISPFHIQTLFGDPLGIQMLIAAGIMQVLGTLVIRKIVNIEY